ncbi:efflux RND transporter periplasmic adaptor subunit [Undibacterium sp. Di24W]|uniref:efflux RND transporter periplasmic adaptor subunit n=1 Tax=Undibacterium sp. Di24W TaxID=3413033 RepID=UPI003BF39AFA
MIQTKNMITAPRSMKLGFLTLSLLSIFVCQLVLAHGDEDHSKKPSAKATAKSNSTLTLTDASAAQRLADGSLFVPKIVQRQLVLRTMLSEVADLPQTIELNGKIIADPNAGGRVQASQSGRVEASSAGLPNLGQKVSKGQVLAYLRPVMTSLDRGNSQATLADLDAQLDIAARKVQRYEQLADALPKATVEAVRFEYEGLKKRKASVEASLSKSEALIAPVSGVISVANAVAGQVVDAKETLFEIIDPSRLMVEALAYDPVLTNDIAKASAKVGSADQSLALNFIGGGQQMREQAIPLLFKVNQVKGKDIAAAVGQPVKVILQTKKQFAGVALPNAAVIKLQGGESVVWIHTDAERFVQRKVKTQALDAQRTLILSAAAGGSSEIKTDERVVISGASLLTQVR